jgi:hypothetical protein
MPQEIARATAQAPLVITFFILSISFGVLSLDDLFRTGERRFGIVLGMRQGEANGSSHQCYFHAGLG